MRWPGGAFEIGAERPRRHRGALPVRVHVGRGRSEHDLDALGAQQFEVVVERARVGIEILSRAELQGIDEDRHDDDAARHPLGGPHQGQMALVQRAHRGHQDDPSPGRSKRARDGGYVAWPRILIQLACGERRRLSSRH